MAKVEIEVGFKINQSLEQAEKLLIDNGFECTYKTITHDVYFGKNINFDSFDETQIKRSLIRCRNFTSLENLKILDETLPDKIKVDFASLVKYLQLFLEHGYEVIFDTKKTDWIYKKGECYHQLQNIEKIGLLDYVYNREIFDKGLSEDEQFNELSKQMEELGFTLQYPLGVDKLRSLYRGKLMFSKNQIGKYDYQD